MLFRILKTIATSGFLTALECTEFVVGQGSVHQGSLQHSPDPLAGLTGVCRKAEGKEEREEIVLTPHLYFLHMPLTTAAAAAAVVCYHYHYCYCYCYCNCNYN